MSTPMQKQYDSLKKKYKDCILLFRLGDFYETFDNDAKIVSKVLNIILTKRGKGENQKPMAGIPYHAIDKYLPKLIKAGYKVAIAEQMEEPQKGKKIVERDVVRIVSAGTITNEKILSESKNNYIASIAKLETKILVTIGLAVCDITTGEFYIIEVCQDKLNYMDKLIEEISRIDPAEILVSEEDRKTLLNKTKKIRIQYIDSNEFVFSDNKKKLLQHFKVKNLKGFGIERYKSGIIASGVLLKYIFETQKTSLSHINNIYIKQTSKYMSLDENTIRSLELVLPFQDESDSTLYKVINKCKTSMGKRKLYNWLLNPLINKRDIIKRYDSVNDLYNDSIALKKLREELNKILDTERILGKVGNQTVNARDLLGLKYSLESSKSLTLLLKPFKSKILMKIYNVLKNTREVEIIIEIISNAISEDPPATIMEGGIIREGYNKKLDVIRSSSKSGKEWLKNLEEKERLRTKINSLKVKFNKVFGYYIEISRSNLDKVPNNYVRKQTLVNAERYITPELKSKEDIILNAEERATNLEHEIFTEVREKISEKISKLQEVSNSIAILDLIANFAEIARLNRYVRPEIISNDDLILEIKDGRHPVVEELQDEPFIPNDINLDCKETQIAIVTGPNMAGKSTYIRQAAIITLLAQIGSFVPASSMKYAPADRIFTRIGARDNLASGESTFLIEMNETANILNNATKRSLIILDEVGRGTSTYDGVAIAWSVVQYIHEKIGAKTLFATHYHELVDLEKFLSRVKNYNIAIKETEGEILFLRKIQKGGTDKSYGVHVASLAGIPNEVITKAREILMSLEQEGLFEVKHIESEITKDKKEVPVQIPLMAKLPKDPIVEELKQLDLNKMTPIEALTKLSDIIKRIKTK